MSGSGDCVERGERYFREPARSDPAGSHDHRSPTERDYARVLHSGAFRRLQGKSQVVHTGHADYFRTRLTHSLEVSQIGRALATRAGISDLYLVDAACLIHDLGHPPFGHNGENALKDWMKNYGGFEANAQSFRIVASLEVKFSPSDTCGRQIGLNLSRETLRASFKYPWPRGPGSAEHGDKFGYYEQEAEADIAVWALGAPVVEGKHVVAAIMDFADDIAYSVHDLEDGVRAGLIPLNALHASRSERDDLVRYWVDKNREGKPRDADTLREGLDTLLGSDLFSWCRHRYDRTDERRGAAKAMTSGLIDRFVRAVTFDELPPTHGEQVHLGERERIEIDVLKAMTWRYVIDSQRLQTLQFRERKIVTDLCRTLLETPNLLPEDKAQAVAATESEERKARIVCDFVAGMTDRFAQSFHARLFGSQPQFVSDLL